jgi:SNF2 family DNA or RNA helicase
MTLAQAIRAAFSATLTQAGLPIVGLRGSSWVAELLDQSPTLTLCRLDQPSAFRGTLRPYQLRGLQWLAFLEQIGLGACLADDMGLGKTIQLIALLLHERRDGRSPGPTLLFAPTSVVANWVREVARFAPDLRVLVHHGPDRLRNQAFVDAAARHDLVITSYALAHRDTEDLGRPRWHRLALDEAQKIKNPYAAATLAIRTLSAPCRTALTGTPLENHLSELWSIMDALNPGLLGSASEFRQRFAVPVEKLGDRDRASHLRNLIRPFVLRRTKRDPAIAGELPQKMEMRVFCNLTPEQAALYRRITDELLVHVDDATGIRRRGLILAGLTRLKQLCNHPSLVLDQAGALDGRSGKCERLVEMLEELLDEGDGALVFTQFKRMGDLLEKLLAERLRRPVLFLHGGTPAGRRQELIDRFQSPDSDARVFILSLRAGGLGLNLTAANHVFHFDRWWNPAVEAQATDRAYRIGQTRNVQVHKFVCVGTMEEKIDKMLSDKIALAENIVGSGDEWLTNLSTEQLRQTLALSQEAVEEF